MQLALGDTDPDDNVPAPVRVGIQSGTIRLEPNGVVAVLENATAELDVPGVSASITVDVQINTQTDPVVLAGITVNPGVLVVAETPDGQGASLNLFGQTLSGNFAFQQVSLPSSPQSTTAPPKVVRIVLSQIELAIKAGDDDVVTLSDGEGFFLLTPTGMAGSLSGGVAISIPGLDASQFSFEGEFGLLLNTAPQPFAEEFVMGGQTITLNVPAGPFLRIQGNDVVIRL
ncbi:MAG: hypothetical protein GY778_09775, partial [bacterium]|nr:hypothetical protein [bacterium]